jgi:hypothetical protein
MRREKERPKRLLKRRWKLLARTKEGIWNCQGIWRGDKEGGLKQKIQDLTECLVYPKERISILLDRVFTKHLEPQTFQPEKLDLSV